MAHQDQKPDFDRFMRIPEVTHVTGLSRSTIYNCVDDGSFPAPVRLTARAIAWRESEVRQWMDERKREVA
jgi:prophage regulatory protein